MANPFESREMAGGYATSRPAIHPRILDRAMALMERREPYRRALDIGCGAGLSTAAARRFACQAIGIDPAEAMLKWASATVREAQFAAGAAEAIPLCASAVDLITAAGSLNYADLDLFFPEALRVLAPGGILLVYDFSPGVSLRDAAGLEEWFAGFAHRYPPPGDEGRALNPEILAELDSGFQIEGHRYFEIEYSMTPDSYLDYIMTETNVAAAQRRGIPRGDIRSWCAETLAPIWNGKEREVLFHGYFACMRPISPRHVQPPQGGN